MKTSRRTTRDEEEIEAQDEDTDQDATSEIEKALRGTPEPEPEGEEGQLIDFGRLMTAIREEVQEIVQTNIIKALSPILSEAKRVTKAVAILSEQHEERAEQHAELVKAVNSALEGSELIKGIVKGRQAEKPIEAAEQNADQEVVNLEKAGILTKQVDLTDEETRKPGELSAAQRNNLPVLLQKGASLRDALGRNIEGMGAVYTAMGNRQPVSVEAYERLEASVQEAENERKLAPA